MTTTLLLVTHVDRSMVDRSMVRLGGMVHGGVVNRGVVRRGVAVATAAGVGVDEGHEGQDCHGVLKDSRTIVRG